MKVNNIIDGMSSVKDYFKDESPIKILTLVGKFLSGKTTIIKNLVSDRNFINRYNVYTYINDWDKYNYLFDITSDFFENSNLQHPEFLSEESQYFVKSFFDSISTLNISNKNLFNEINKYLLIDNETEFGADLKDKVESSISNELKRNLILYYYEISIECLLTDLLNNYFPLSNDINSLSEILITKNPIKILLIFDDTQTVPSKIYKWFVLFLDYITNRKLGDLKLYDYQGVDSEIKFSEFFEINLIFVNRDQPFNIKNDKINSELVEVIYSKMDSQEIKTLIDKKDSPIYKIPALLNTYNELERDKEFLTLVYAANQLLKYVPEDYQRAILFCVAFEKFTLIDINLFEEIELSEKEFESVMNKSDFILQEGLYYSFDKNSLEILSGVFKTLFKSYDVISLRTISTQIRDLFQNLKYDEFEILRELSYFKNFDKSYVIDNYFDNPKNIHNFIETNIHFFDRDKSFFSIIEKYLLPLQEYNKYRDINNKDEKNEIIKSIFYDYQKEIEKRNDILQNDVIKVGDEISDFLKEKSLMEEKSEGLSKEVISHKNELYELEQKLKPFIHQNSKRKSSINVIALLLSVAVIFNSDTISLYLFGQTSEFVTIILITCVLLLLLYGNGLLRYFRVKFKSEELYSFTQNQNNIESKILGMDKELEVLNADIRAKNSKIEDLKKHIERMNLQILENKQKLEKEFIH